VGLYFGKKLEQEGKPIEGSIMSIDPISAIILEKFVYYILPYVVGFLTGASINNNLYEDQNGYGNSGRPVISVSTLNLPPTPHSTQYPAMPALSILSTPSTYDSSESK
jgi:hypothetical protein